MPSYGTSHDEWLLLKHRTKPRAYGFSCGARDSDWDFAERTPNSYSSYAFASADGPIQLRNNMGGMDEDEDVPKDVWYPHQPQQQSLGSDSGIGSDSASGSEYGRMDIEMDIEMTMDISIDVGASNQMVQNAPSVQAQQAPQHMTASGNSPVNKRKRNSDIYEMNTGGAGYDAAFIGNDITKRIRVGA